jgi:four helix bundle protein
MGGFMEFGGKRSCVGEHYSYYNDNRDFKSLSAWKKCREVKLFLYSEILTKLPKEEKYNAGIQIRRAAISITANIAEGYGRYHYQEGIQFYRIARASLYELKDHLISCHDLNFISNKLYLQGISLIESAKTTLNGYINYVRNQSK